MRQISGGPHKFLSLFSGCGGFDIGFEASGFSCCGAYDIDQTAIYNYQRNLRCIAHVTDLSRYFPTISSSQNIDVVLAGPPCQGFSTAGKRILNDPRNHLMLRAGEIAINILPKIFVLENVAGLLSGPHKQFLDIVISKLRRAGYKTQTIKVRALELGLPQIRTRMLLIAWRTRSEKVPELKGNTPASLRSTLDCMAGVPNHFPIYLDPDSNLAKIAKRIGTNQKLCNVRASTRSVHTWQIPEVFGKTTKLQREILETVMRLRRRERLRVEGDADPVLKSSLERVLSRSLDDDLMSLLRAGYLKRVGKRFDLTQTYNGKFRRLSWDEPSFTVDTRFGDPRLFLHPDEHRGFTVREAARIQGFPDSYLFTGSIQEQFRMIGNAVPPPFGAAVAKIVKGLLE